MNQCITCILICLQYHFEYNFAGHMLFYIYNGIFHRNDTNNNKNLYTLFMYNISQYTRQYILGWSENYFILIIIYETILKSGRKPIKNREKKIKAS